MKVKIAASGLYAYPDVVIVRGGPAFEDDHEDVLVNPTVLIEVLSKTTEDYDRGTKWKHYRKFPSLREYIVVSQKEQLVERYRRETSSNWAMIE